MNTKLIMLPIFLIISFSLSAEVERGRVIDSNTKEPIEYVSITLQSHPSIGYKSNSEGIFEMVVTEKIRHDTISFRHLGYLDLDIAYTQLKQQDFHVELQPRDYDISGVVVFGKAGTRLPEVKVSKITSLRYGIHSFDPLLIDNRIYIIGGDISLINQGKSMGSLFSAMASGDNSYYEYNDKMHIYDIKEDRWIVGEQKFRERAYHGAHYYNGRIYVLGGKNLSTNARREYLDDIIEIYDIEEDTIVFDNNNPHQAVNFASGIYEHYLIVAGGSVKEYANNVITKKDFIDKVHLLDLKTGEWFKLNSLPEAKESRGIMVDNLFYCVGGQIQTKMGTDTTRNISIYNMNSGEWTNEASLAYAVDRPGLAHYNGTIFIFDNNIVQTYNTNTRELRAYRTSLPFILKSPTLLYDDKKLYIIGGYIGDTVDASNVTKITPSWDIFSIDIHEFGEYLDRAHR